MNEKEDTVTHTNVNNGKSPCTRSRAIDIRKYLLHSVYVLVLLSLGAVSTLLGQTKGAVSPPVQAAAPWSGDFDGMLKRHYLAHW